MNKKLIGVITPSQFPGTAGDTANYTEMINQFICDGLSTLVVCPKLSKAVARKELSLPDFRIIRVPYDPPRLEQLKDGIKTMDYVQLFLFLLAELFTVLGVVCRWRIRSVYMRHSLLTLQIPLLLRLCGVKIIADGELVSDSLEKVLPNSFFMRVLRSYERKIIGLYAYFKVSTRHQAEHLEKIGFLKEKIMLIPMSINIDNVPKYQIENIPEHTFGYFGALEHWQGSDILVDGFKLLLNKIPNAILYVIGEGSMKKDLKDQIAKENLAKNIIHVDGLPREKIWENYFSKFRILVIPRPLLGNSIDTLPSIKLVEGLAAGKVIIATDIPAMREIPTDTIILVKPGDAVSLARAMESLSNDRNKLQQYSNAASRISSNYDIRANISNLVKALRD